jgi:hypothetical protein
MKQAIILILSLILCLKATISAGIEEKLSPTEVTEKFWTAIKANDISALREYITSKSLKEDDLTSPLPHISEFKLNKAIIEGGQARIKTTVVVMGDKLVTVPAETVLIRENGQWKVLYRETVEMVTEASELSRILNNFQELSKIFAKKFDKSVDKLQQSLPIVEHKLKEIKEKLKTEIPGIEDQLKGIAKELDDLFNSLQQAPPPEKEQSI